MPLAVLVVEDEPAVLGVVARSLTAGGYQVLRASTGAEALQICRARLQPIQVLITDVMLPDASGWNVAEECLAVFPDLGVLYMSGYAEENLIAQGRLGQGSFLIQKPFSPVALTDKLAELLAALPTRPKPGLHHSRAATRSKITPKCRS